MAAGSHIAANESGPSEVYVLPFPSGAGKWQISTRRGRLSEMATRWSRAVLHEQLSRRGGRLMAVDVRIERVHVRSGNAQGSVRLRICQSVSLLLFHPYAVAPDGQRFLIPRPVAKVTERHDGVFRSSS